MKQKDDIIISEDIPKNTKATLKRLLKYLGKQKRKLLLITFMAMLSSGLYGIIPLVVGQAIDSLLKAIQNYDGTSSVIAVAGSVLLVPTLLLAASALGSSIFSYIQQYVVSTVGENLTLSLRKDVSGKINRLPLNYFDTHTTGEVLSRVTSDLEKVSEVMQVGLMQAITAIFTIVVTVVLMFTISPVLSVVVLVTVGISTVATNYISMLNQHYFAQNQEALGALSGKVEELYAGNRIIKILNRQRQAVDEVIDLNKKQFEANKKAQFVNHAIYPLIRIINQLGFVAVAIGGGLMALQGKISLGAIQAFLQYVNQIGEPVTQAAYVINSLQAAVAGAERVFILLDEEEEPEDKKSGKLAVSNGRVTFDHVRFGYSPEKTLINDLSLEVKPNEMVAIVGPTGGGKTTLINLLMRFYELGGGNISVDGVDITSIPRKVLRRQIGMVLQDTWLFEGTVAENIAYGKMDASREEIIAASKAARCDHFIRTLPHGYDTLISSEASLISQGQMQLLTIARAMLTNPGIMILDEATSSVDTRTEVEIQKAMTQLMKDKTSFVIAHRLSTIKNADMILVVKDGDIVERGTHKSLLLAKGFYASLYNSQFDTAG